MVSSTPRPHFTARRDPVPILQEAGWAPGPVWTGGKSRPHRDFFFKHLLYFESHTKELNLSTPNDHYSGRTAPLTSKRCILYIYSTNSGTEYFKHGIYCPYFSLQNAVCFIILTYLVPVLFTFYIQSVLK